MRDIFLFFHSCFHSSLSYTHMMMIVVNWKNGVNNTLKQLEIYLIIHHQIFFFTRHNFHIFQEVMNEEDCLTGLENNKKVSLDMVVMEYVYFVLLDIAVNIYIYISVNYSRIFLFSLFYNRY